MNGMIEVVSCRNGNDRREIPRKLRSFHRYFRTKFHRCLVVIYARSSLYNKGLFTGIGPPNLITYFHKTQKNIINTIYQ